MRNDLELLGERIAEHATHIDAAMHRLLTDVRAFDQGGGWHAQGARSRAHWLTWRVGWSPGTAREHVRVATKLGALPVLDEALSTGQVSYSKLRAMTRVATPANEALLLEDARHTDAAQLERICRAYALVQRQDATPSEDAERRHVTRRDTEDGMVRIEAVLHPEEAAIVWAALARVTKELAQPDAAVPAGTSPSVAADGTDTTRHAQAENVPAGTPPRVTPFDRADALVSIAQDVVRGTSQDRAPVDVVITISRDAITNVATDPIEQVAICDDGTCTSVHAARRACCDSGVIEIFEDEHGTPLSVGRKTRSIPASMKRALLRRDGTCRFPGCTNRVFVEGHHITHWVDGGETSLANLVTMCSHHHRFVHEYGYRIEPTSAGPRFFDRNDRQVHAVPPRRHLPALGLPALIAANQQLAITPETAACGWDGRTIDYAAVIDDLVWADRPARSVPAGTLSSVDPPPSGR